MPALPPSVRVSLADGKIVFEGAITRADDAGAVEVVRSMFPDSVDRVTRGDALPEP